MRGLNLLYVITIQANTWQMLLLLSGNVCLVWLCFFVVGFGFFFCLIIQANVARYSTKCLTIWHFPEYKTGLPNMFTAKLPSLSCYNKSVQVCYFEYKAVLMEDFVLFGGVPTVGMYIQHR